jgi:hypothetical protein
MGVSGTSVFSDDLAADTRDTFTDYIAEGLGAVEATDRLVAESADALDDEDDANVFWIALAATQWKFGPTREGCPQQGVEDYRLRGRSPSLARLQQIGDQPA